MALPFPDDHFDAVTVSFGLRNMKVYLAAITEMTRVIEPGGRFICLELTPYRVPVLGRLFNWYFTRIVPRIGGWLSGDAEAYRYLPTSVASFPDAKTLSVNAASRPRRRRVRAPRPRHRRPPRRHQTSPTGRLTLTEHPIWRDVARGRCAP